MEKLASNAEEPVKGSKSRHWSGVLCALLVSTLAVSCGSSSSSSSGGAATEESVTAAKASVGELLKPPPDLGPEAAPLSKPAPEGKTVYVHACQLDSCLDYLKQAKIAGEALGWNVVTVNNDGTPEDILDKVGSSLDEAKIDGIIINGAPRSSYEAVAEKAVAKGVPIVSQWGDLDEKAEAPWIAVQGLAKEFDAVTIRTGDYVIADSGGKANALAVGYSEFEISTHLAETLKQRLDDKCPGCETKLMIVKAADTGTKLPSQIVSEIQRNPSINYIMMQEAAMTLGLDAALREADLLGKVKVVANNCNATAAAGMIDGSFQMMNAFSTKAAAYQGMDALAREFVGDKQISIPIMSQGLEQDDFKNAPKKGGEVDPALWTDIPPNLPDLYKKLWLVS